MAGAFEGDGGWWIVRFEDREALGLGTTGMSSLPRACLRKWAVGVLSLAIVFGRALGDELAAVFAGFGAEVEDPVGGFDDFEVVFDDEQGVAGIDEFLENALEGVRCRRSGGRWWVRRG